MLNIYNHYNLGKLINKYKKYNDNDSSFTRVNINYVFDVCTDGKCPENVINTIMEYLQEDPTSTLAGENVPIEEVYSENP